MWYAPVGSLEYTKSLHNDILIKRYILSEQRLKQQNINVSKVSSRLSVKKKSSNSANVTKTTESVDIRRNRIKGCAVDVQIQRSFRKTVLDVVTYDSTLKTRPSA